MAANLIAVLEQVLGSNDVVAKIAAFIGLSPERTKTAIGGAVPAILAGLVGLAQKPAGRDQLAATVRNQDPGLLDRFERHAERRPGDVAEPIGQHPADVAVRPGHGRQPRRRDRQVRRAGPVDGLLPAGRCDAGGDGGAGTRAARARPGCRGSGEPAQRSEGQHRPRPAERAREHAGLDRAARRHRRPPRRRRRARSRRPPGRPGPTPRARRASRPLRRPAPRVSAPRAAARPGAGPSAPWPPWR